MDDGKHIDRKVNWVTGYIGTCFSSLSKGVYQFYFNKETGELAGPELFHEANDAIWLSRYQDYMVLPVEREHAAGIRVLKFKDNEVQNSDEVLEEKVVPCYIYQDGEYIYTANYQDGTVLIYQLKQDQLIIVKRIECGESAGCHQILIHDRYLMVPCLQQNKIRLFDKREDFTPAGQIEFPNGSGPRHGVFNQAHTRLYVVSEWSNELFVFNVRKKEFILTQVLSIMPGKKAASAAIRLTKDERFLYISVRFEDYIIVLDAGQNEVKILQQVSCGGSHPRDFILSEDENFILVANRFDGGVVCFRRDRQNGKILELCGRIVMPEGVALLLSNSV